MRVSFFNVFIYDSLVRFIAEVILEVLLLFFYPLFGWIENFLPKRKEIIDPQMPTIVLVERWFSTNPLHRRMAQYLEKKGFNVLLHNLPLQRGTFAESAKELKKYIDSRNLRGITLVGISNGGVSCLLYLQQEDGWKHVSHFISVGAPFGGTPTAYFLFPFRSGRELFPRSQLAKDIQGMSLERKDDMYCLQAKIDELIPSSSSHLPGTKKYIIDVIGHNALHLVSQRTYAKIAEVSVESASGR